MPTISEDVRADLQTLLSRGIVVRRLPDLEAKRWRQRLASLAHKRGVSVLAGTTPDGHVWVALAGRSVDYRPW